MCLSVFVCASVSVHVSVRLHVRTLRLETFGTSLPLQCRTRTLRLGRTGSAFYSRWLTQPLRGTQISLRGADQGLGECASHEIEGLEPFILIPYVVASGKRNAAPIFRHACTTHTEEQNVYFPRWKRPRYIVCSLRAPLTGSGTFPRGAGERVRAPGLSRGVSRSPPDLRGAASAPQRALAAER